MKKIYFVLLLLNWFFITNAQTADDPAENILNGLWLNYTDNPPLSTIFSNYGSELKGVFIAFKWSELQPTANVNSIDFTNLNSKLTEIATNGFKIALIIYTGPDAPQWLYNINVGVPKYCSSDGNTYPEYMNATYQSRWHTLLDKLFQDINNNPTIKNNLVIFESAEGSTGDEGPFKGDRKVNCSCTTNCTIDWPYQANTPSWISFRESSWVYINSELTTYFYNASRPSHSNVTLLVNPGNPVTLIPQYTSWLSSNLPYAWLKAGAAGHAYQLNDEVTQQGLYDPFINTVQGTNCPTLTKVRSRSEMAADQAGWFTEAPKWNFYWTTLSSLYFGLDLWMNTYYFLANPNYQSSFPLYNKYAGLKDPRCTDKGFIALRDGLDAFDTDRFPTDEPPVGFGPGNEKDYTTRADNIVKAFAGYGAKQEDPLSANGSPMQQRLALALNDVGWGIYPGNYERYIHQVNLPPGRYQGGLWRKGPVTGTVPNDPYGRFAKGFDLSITPQITDFYFNVDDNLAISSLDNNATHSAHLHIVYLCTYQGKKFQVKYYVKESGSPVPKTITVNFPDGNLTPTWEVFDKDIDKLYIDNKINGNADIQLHYVNAANTAFHLIEISSQTSQGVISSVQTEISSSTLSVTPNPGKGLFSISWPSSVAANAVTVFNSSGQMILQKRSFQEHNCNLDLASYQAGVYLVQVQTKNSMLRAKLIKE